MASLESITKQFEPRLTDSYIKSSVNCEFVTGAAGTGKTYTQQKLIEENPNHGILCATTGIAAINLGASTLNSVLKYFDTESLRDLHARGRLTSALHSLGKNTKRLVIDEVSMMDGKQLDYIYDAMLHANEYKDMEGAPMGITLTGDFCQLPPVKAPWAFEADCWEHFERGTNTLTKIWRQDNPEFLEAINAARSGQGTKCAQILKEIGVRFVPQQNGRFAGTTILSKNDQVDNYNFAALLDLPGTAFGLNKQTWGDQAGEWKNIPDVLKLKEGAYVMILANSGIMDEESYANGDCGIIQSKDIDGTIWVKLKRNDKLVGINPIVRTKTAKDDDALFSYRKNFPELASFKTEKYDPFEYHRMEHIYCDQKECAISSQGIKWVWDAPSYNCTRGSFNVGGVKYYPLRLAYATTVHKSQGLTLDVCQIDCRDGFFGNPSMAYVALSRCRTPEGLVVVGTPDKLAERIKCEPKVRRWL